MKELRNVETQCIASETKTTQCVASETKTTQCIASKTKTKTTNRAQAVITETVRTVRYSSFVIAIAALLLLGGCKKKKSDDEQPPKSTACEIVTFKVGDNAWQISGTSITFQYPKGTTPGSLTPAITLSAGATVNPTSGTAQAELFSANGVTYKVTAEDGKTAKTYIAKATVATTK
jgi:hypothetical protein